MHRQVPKCPGRREKWLNYKKLFNFYFSYLFNIVSWIDAGSILAKFLIFYSYNRIALNDIIFENLKYWISYECFFHSSINNSSSLLGASTGEPAHYKVMRKRPDRQGGSGLEGLPGPAQASTLKPKSVCLLFTILCFSPTFLTLTGAILDHLSLKKKKNQLKALVISLLGLKGVFQF